MTALLREAKDGPAPARRRPVLSDPSEDAGQPDPVTLCEPSFDESGLLRWASTKN